MSTAIERVERDDQVDERLTGLWRTPNTIIAWLLTVDHKALGIRYIVTAFFFFVLGGLQALVMRIQLARPDTHLLSPELYNQLFSLHGTTMMFLFIQPVLSGFSFYLTPLMIGARELAFPRLNTFSYYAFLFAGLFIYAGLIGWQAPDGGWFNYTPLTGPVYDPGRHIDFYTLGLLFLGISTTAGAINSIVTIWKLRAPGMSIDRMPLFLWSSLTASFSVVFAMPALTAALVLLALERQWHFVFFNPALGGHPLLWQHLFWVFGHPWVYIVFLPATGMLSMIIPVFSRRPMVGHSFVALATVSTGLAGFGVWVHHMFATGLPQLSLTFFSAGSMTVSIPSAVQIVAWITTMWYGRVVLKTPMLYALGFIVQFVIGGISGVMTASVPFDWQATDTYFIVAHLHYVLAGGSLFAVLAGLYYWYPKMTGRLLHERLGQASFWVTFVGFNVAFFPMHVSGLLGMPRRVYTYAAGLGWETPNMLSTVGTLLLAIGLGLTLWNVVRSLFAGAPAGENPWHGNTLEWATSSPPEHYNFAHIPLVKSRDPLWRNDVDAGPAYAEARLTPKTSALDGALERAIVMPTPHVQTLVLPLALLVFFAGLLVRWNLLAVLGGIVSLLSMALWMWPARASADDETNGESADGDDIAQTVGWWGMMLVCATEATLFACFLLSYFYLGVSNLAWPPTGIERPSLLLPSLMTVALVSSSAVLYWGERGGKHGNAFRLRTGLGGAIVLGIVFLLLQLSEYRHTLPHAPPTASAYASIFFTTTGFHGAHVAFGLLLLLFTGAQMLKGRATRGLLRTFRITSLYWHFVDAVWLCIFASLYLSPHLL